MVIIDVWSMKHVGVDDDVNIVPEMRISHRIK